MSDTTPTDGNKNSGKDASATSNGRHETRPVGLDPYADAARREADARDGAATTATTEQAASAHPGNQFPTGEQAHPGVPIGEPISYDAPEASAPAPVASRESAPSAYVPAASVNATGETERLEPLPAETHAAETPAYAPANTTVQPPIYIQAPAAPRYKSNRGPGVVIALLSAMIFAVLYALVAFALSGIGSLSIADTAAKFTDFIVLPIFYVPVIFFFVAFALLVLIVNRGGWWAYVLFGFLVAVAVYFSYIGAALLSVQAWNFTPDQAARFISQQWLNPGAIAAAVVAREVPIWAGAWIARNGRAVTTRNETAKAEYDRVLAAGPQGIRSN
ncbi:MULTISPECIES: hypothetical protein [Cryobacterium]|uniref:ABC transporter n=1 Tax=Cryobacterium breve TaxID=1259258 RepID=A0ABY2J090_9MICO|nr:MULTISPECIES: hypothetical protein [Cryobacterium]TFC91825.1 hypothetical protein E3T20_13320 [Cryobacterium sp. TmT3-12]TFC98376.1 hypothetical protein E3O65_08540 [Cryobacterium breve]